MAVSMAAVPAEVSMVVAAGASMVEAVHLAAITEDHPAATADMEAIREAEVPTGACAEGRPWDAVTGDGPGKAAVVPASCHRAGIHFDQQAEQPSGAAGLSVAGPPDGRALAEQEPPALPSLTGSGTALEVVLEWEGRPGVRAHVP